MFPRRKILFLTKGVVNYAIFYMATFMNTRSGQCQNCTCGIFLLLNWFSRTIRYINATCMSRPFALFIALLHTRYCVIYTGHFWCCFMVLICTYFWVIYFLFRGGMDYINRFRLFFYSMYCNFSSIWCIDHNEMNHKAFLSFDKVSVIYWYISYDNLQANFINLSMQHCPVLKKIEFDLLLSRAFSVIYYVDYNRDA